MRVLFDSLVTVHYGQFYIVPPGQPGPELDDAFRGQSNGLLGAAVPGKLWIITGLHTGHVKLVIRFHDAEPSFDPDVEDIVEASIMIGADSVVLSEWAGGREHKLDLPTGDLRVRLSCAGMDAAREKDTILDDEPHIDTYAIDFWLAPPKHDAIVRQSSDVAAYWHNWVATLAR